MNTPLKGAKDWISSVDSGWKSQSLFQNHALADLSFHPILKEYFEYKGPTGTEIEILGSNHLFLSIDESLSNSISLYLLNDKSNIRSTNGKSIGRSIVIDLFDEGDRFYICEINTGMIFVSLYGEKPLVQICNLDTWFCLLIRTRQVLVELGDRAFLHRRSWRWLFGDNFSGEAKDTMWEQWFNVTRDRLLIERFAKSIGWG